MQDDDAINARQVNVDIARSTIATSCPNLVYTALPT